MKAEFYFDLPEQMGKQSCRARFGGCYLDNIGQNQVPIFSGFLLSRVIRKDHGEQYVYNSGGSSYAPRPI